MATASCVRVFEQSENKNRESVVGIVTERRAESSGANKNVWIYISTLPRGFMMSTGTGLL